jgi:hypothetical protein
MQIKNSVGPPFAKEANRQTTAPETGVLTILLAKAVDY